MCSPSFPGVVQQSSVSGWGWWPKVTLIWGPGVPTWPAGQCQGIFLRWAEEETALVTALTGFKEEPLLLVNIFPCRLWVKC